MNVFIVAEVGVNHNLDYRTACRLVDAAAEAKVDACKFQLWGQNTFPSLGNLRLPREWLVELKQRTENYGMKWFCTAFDLGSVKFLASLGMRIWKVPNNKTVWGDLSLMREIMAQEGDLWLSSAPVSDVPCIPLHCVSLYPCPPEKAALRGLGMRQFPWGISDHSGLPEIPIAAVTLGAKVVECHITLDKNAEGPDHRASLNPNEFAYIVKAIRNVEKAIA